MMMSFCKKSVHSFLGFNTNSEGNETLINFSSHHHHHNHHRDFSTTAAGGLGLFSIYNNIQKTPNVVESAFIKSSTAQSATDTQQTTASTGCSAFIDRKDPGGVGFIDEVGGSVDGLMSCTESLGFESLDERRVDDHNMEKLEHDVDMLSEEKSNNFRSIWRKKHVKREVKKFPPPISSLDVDGRPTIYLHPVRKDGRLELTGVKIDRKPEILRASRENGRLRLHLIRDDKDEIDEENEEQEEVQQEIQEKSGIEIIEKKEDRTDHRWQFRVASGVGGGGGGDGDVFRRCNEAVSHHYHHRRDLNVWRQHCLTIT